MEINSALTKIGNSSGVILQKKLLEEAGIEKHIIIHAESGIIIIKPANKKEKILMDRSKWEKQIKLAIKAGNKPEKDIWDESISTVADKDWTWPNGDVKSNK